MQRVIRQKEKIAPRVGAAERRQGEREGWLESFAILGDSEWALAVSFLILLAAVVISLSMEENDGWMNSLSLAMWKVSQDDDDDPYTRLGPVPAVDPPRIFVVQSPDNPFASEEMSKAYRKDGVVAVRGLIDTDLLDALDKESARLVLQKEGGSSSRKRKTQFHTVSHGAIFQNSSNNTTEETWTPGPFWELALGSSVSALAAQLLQGELTETTGETAKNLRVMRDILLSKDDDAYVCGWHVDDLGFWPATPDAPGVNAWIALDDMPVKHGGGFALAVGSHAAPWREEAHLVTGASTTFPSSTGYRSAKDMLAQRTGSGTCNLEQAAPHLHRRMEETKRQYAVQRGDVLFHTRWLFHRTVAFERSYVAEQEDAPVYRRYSIRYSPGSSTIPPGYGTEWSVLWDEENGGLTANEVCERDGPWYPQAWPTALETERQAAADLVGRKMTVADERRSQRQREMKTLLKKQTMQQHHRTKHHTKHCDKP